MAHQIATVEWKHVKTFATEANLRKFIEKHAAENVPDYHNDRLFIMQTPEGRWTAVVKLDLTTGGYVGRWPFLAM